MKGLLDHSLRYTLAALMSRGALVVALIILPHFLSPRQYGALGMVTVVATLVSTCVPLEIGQGLARYFQDAGPERGRTYASTAWWFTLVALLGTALCALVFARPLTVLVLRDVEYITVFRVMVGYCVVSTLFLFLQNQNRWEFRTGGYVAVSIGYALFTLGLSLVLAATMDDPLLGVVIGQTAGGALVVTAAIWQLRYTFAVRPSAHRLREMLSYSLPLVPANIAMVASIYAGRFLLNTLANLRDVGLFTYASQIASMPGLAILGIQAAITPLVMARHGQPETPRAIGRFFEQFAGIAISVCLAFGLFAGPCIVAFGSPAYISAGPLVMILAPAYLLLQVYIFAPGFAIARRTGQQMLVSIAGACVAVALNFQLIGWLGIMGAAIATLGGAAVFILLWWVLSQRLYPIVVRWPRVALVAVVAVAAGLTDLLLTWHMSLGAALILKIGMLAAVVATAVFADLITPATLKGSLGGIAARIRPAPEAR